MIREIRQAQRFAAGAWSDEFLRHSSRFYAAGSATVLIWCSGGARSNRLKPLRVDRRAARTRTVWRLRAVYAPGRALTPDLTARISTAQRVGIERAIGLERRRGNAKQYPATPTTSSVRRHCLCSTRASRRHDPRAPQRGSRRRASPRFVGGFFFGVSSSNRGRERTSVNVHEERRLVLLLEQRLRRGDCAWAQRGDLRIVGLGLAEDDRAPLRVQAPRDRCGFIHRWNG